MARRKSSRHQGPKKRRPAIYEPNKLVLIICEGGETEPQYFKGLNSEWRFVTIKFIPFRGNDPIGIVQRAIELKEQKGINYYDEIWCVFDTEGEKDSPAIIEAKAIAKNNKIELAISHPCFDFWLLLHLKYTTHSFMNCGEVESYLIKKEGFSQNYKSDLPMHELLPNIDQALEHANQLRQDTVITNPATDVDKLVRQLKAFHEEQSRLKP